eukprot:jgi/Mesvir1/26902/Mv20630-RA.1
MGTRLLTVALMEPDAQEREKILDACAAFVSRGDFFSVVEALRMKEYANLLRGEYGFNRMGQAGAVFKFNAPMVVMMGCVQIQKWDAMVMWDAYKDALFRCPLGNLIDVESGRCGTCKKLPPPGKKHVKCGRCLTTRYCGRLCQLEAYDKHKRSCRVAARAMKKGLQEHLDDANAVIAACSLRLGMDLRMRDKDGKLLAPAPDEEEEDADVAGLLAEFGVTADDFSNVIVI